VFKSEILHLILCLKFKINYCSCNEVPVNTNGDWPSVIEKYAIVDDTMTTKTLLPVVNKIKITE